MGSQKKILFACYLRNVINKLYMFLVRFVHHTLMQLVVVEHVFVHVFSFVCIVKITFLCMSIVQLCHHIKHVISAICVCKTHISANACCFESKRVYTLLEVLLH